MPETCEINYNGVRLCPIDEELRKFAQYTAKYTDRTSTFTSYSRLLTQLDGIGTVEFEEQERIGII